MRKPEQILWDRVRGKLTPDEFFLQRIELMQDVGMPDVMVQRKKRANEWGLGRTTALELKMAPRMPVREDTQLLSNENGLRVSQKNWLHEWTRYGGHSWVLIGVKESRVHIAVPGRHADSINGASLLELINLDGAFMGIGPGFWLDFKGVM